MRMVEPELPQSSELVGASERQAAPLHLDDVAVFAFPGHAERAHAAECAGAVGAGGIIFETRGAFGDSRQHGVTVGDGLVSGQLDTTAHVARGTHGRCASDFIFNQYREGSVGEPRSCEEITESVFTGTTRLPTGFQLGQGFRFGGGFFQDVRRDFFKPHVEFEHGGLGAAAPAGDFPVEADELHVGMRGQIKQQRRLTAIKFLGKAARDFAPQVSPSGEP